MKIKILLLALGLWLLFFSKRAHSQIPGSMVYTDAHGYPAFSGYIIDQDSRGFIWVGTDQGAVKFDGAHFEVFDKSNGVPVKEVLLPIAAQDSTVLLIPLLNNLSYYQNGKIINGDDARGLSLVQHENHTRALEDKFTGTIWIGDNQNAGYLHRFVNGYIEKVAIEVPYEFELWGAVDNELMLRAQNYPAEGHELLFTYNVSDKTTHYIKSEPTGLHKKEAIILGKNAVFLAATSKNGESVMVYEKTSDSSFSHKATLFCNALISRCVIDKFNHLWILLRNGGIQYAGAIDQVQNSDSHPLLLPGLHINDVFVDRDTNVWMTTHLNGLHFVPKKHWQNALTTKGFLATTARLRTLTPFGNNSFLASFFDQNTLQTIPDLKVMHRSNMIHNGFKNVLSIPNANVIVLANEVRMEVLTLRPDHSVKALQYVDNIGALKRLAAYDDRSFIATFHDGLQHIFLNEHKDSLLGEYIFTKRSTATCVFPDKSIAIGTPKGLYMLSPEGVSKKVCPLLATENITDLVGLSPQEAIVSTSNGGLFLFNKEHLSSELLVEPERLQSALINRVSQQSPDTYWLATDLGLFKVTLDPAMELKELKRYTFFDGLPSNQIQNVLVKNNRVFVSTLNGFTLFDPKERPNEQRPELWIEKAQWGDTLVHFPNKVSLQFPVHQLRFGLSAIAFGTENHEYAYRILELDSGWNLSKSPQININYLNPGAYTLEVHSAGKDRLSGVTKFPITVLPLYWQTLWFKTATTLLLVTVLLVGIYLWARWYKKRVYRKAKERRRMAELELEAIKAQINPHFISNCLNSIQYFHLKNEHQSASEYLDLFARLINLTLKFSQESFVELREEIDYLESYLCLEKMRFEEQLSYQILVDQEIDEKTLVPALLIQPYLENALKHGIPSGTQPGHLCLRFGQQNAHWLQVSVRDNGPGILHTAQVNPYSLGMKLSANRARSYKQLFKLEIETQINDLAKAGTGETGTEVLLTIPLIEHENPSILQQLHR